MLCYFVRRLVQAYLGDGLRPGDAARVRRHSERCERCREAMTGAQETARLVASLPRPALEPAALEAMLAGVRTRGQERLGARILGTPDPAPVRRKPLRQRAGEWADALRHGATVFGLRITASPITIPASATVPVAALLLILLHQGMPEQSDMPVPALQEKQLSAPQTNDEGLAGGERLFRNLHGFSSQDETATDTPATTAPTTAKQPGSPAGAPAPAESHPSMPKLGRTQGGRQPTPASTPAKRRDSLMGSAAPRKEHDDSKGAAQLRLAPPPAPATLHTTIPEREERTRMAQPSLQGVPAPAEPEAVSGLAAPDTKAMPVLDEETAPPRGKPGGNAAADAVSEPREQRLHSADPSPTHGLGSMSTNEPGARKAYSMGADTPPAPTYGQSQSPTAATAPQTRPLAPRAAEGLPDQQGATAQAESAGPKGASTQTLIRQLTGKPEEAIEAARQLGQRREKQAVPALTRALRQGGRESLRAAAADALGAIGSPEAMRALRLTAAAKGPGQEPARATLKRLGR